MEIYFRLLSNKFETITTNCQPGEYPRNFSRARGITVPPVLFIRDISIDENSSRTRAELEPATRTIERRRSFAIVDVLNATRVYILCHRSNETEYF